MAVKIRHATEKDTQAVVELYERTHDYLEANVNYPGWSRGIYPTSQDAQKGIDGECMFVASIDDRIVGSIILRKQDEPAYAAAPWQATLADDEVMVIHTFAVDPACRGQGVGSAMLSFTLQYAKELGCKAVRLDVYEKNMPAEQLYKKSGFTYIGTVSLGLEVYGLDHFKLYERLL